MTIDKKKAITETMFVTDSECEITKKGSVVFTKTAKQVESEDAAVVMMGDNAENRVTLNGSIQVSNKSKIGSEQVATTGICFAGSSKTNVVETENVAKINVARNIADATIVETAPP